MFVRKKKNRSGTTSVVVINKDRGVFKELVTIGVSKDDAEIEHAILSRMFWGNKDG